MIKQPLKKMYVSGENVDKILKEFEGLLKDELNIKEIESVKDDSMFNDEFLSVNFKKAGAVLKGDVQALKTALGELSAEENAKVVEGFKNGKVTVGRFNDLDSDLFNLEKKPKGDFVIAHENNKTVVLDITIDKELLKEGLYREFVRGLQVLRKEADFAIDDRIKASFKTDDEELQQIVEENLSKIKEEVLVKEVCDKLTDAVIEKEVEVGDGKITVQLGK